MAETHPVSLGESVGWMAEDAQANRRRGGGLSMLAVGIFRLDQFGVPLAAVGTAYPAPGSPVIGDRVYIGAHASVLGPVPIGDDAFLGTRALVLRDREPGAVAVGVPADVIEPTSALR
jgi:hypothetical protein